MARMQQAERAASNPSRVRRERERFVAPSSTRSAPIRVNRLLQSKAHLAVALERRREVGECTAAL